MSYWAKLMTTTALLVAAAAYSGAVRAQDSDALTNPSSEGNWLTYHGSYITNRGTTVLSSKLIAKTSRI